MTGSVH